MVEQELQGEMLAPIDDSDLSKLCKETLEKGNNLRFRALGSSMFPSIRSGDVITVKPVESAAICVGNVLFYRRDGRVYAHRLIRKHRMDGVFLFITRGDYLPFSDPSINPSQVFGKVVSIERGRRIIRLDTPLQRRWGRVLALTSPLFYPLLSVAGVTFHIIRRVISKYW
jgi:signal peptidase I